MPIFALWIFSLLSAGALAGSGPHIAAEDSWPPYSDTRGEGISRRLVNAAFATQGLTPRYSVMPYARVLHSISSGAVDGGFNVTRQQTTEARFLFGREPLLQASASWYFRPGEAQRYPSFDSIPANFSVGLIIDYEYGDQFEPLREKIREVRVTRQSQLIRMLLSKRVDAIVLFDRVADYTLKQMQLPSSALERGFQNHLSNIYVAFSRRRPQAQFYADQLDAGLRQLRSSGEYQQLLGASTAFAN